MKNSPITDTLFYGLRHEKHNKFLDSITLFREKTDIYNTEVPKKFLKYWFIPDSDFNKHIEKDSLRILHEFIRIYEDRIFNQTNLFINFDYNFIFEGFQNRIKLALIERKKPGLYKPVPMFNFENYNLLEIHPDEINEDFINYVQKGLFKRLFKF